MNLPNVPRHRETSSGTVRPSPARYLAQSVGRTKLEMPTGDRLSLSKLQGKKRFLHRLFNFPRSSLVSSTTIHDWEIRYRARAWASVTAMYSLPSRAKPRFLTRLIRTLG